MDTNNTDGCQPFFFNSETKRLVESAMFRGPYGAIARTMYFYGQREPVDRYESGDDKIGRYLPVIWLYIKAYEYYEYFSSTPIKRWLYRVRLRLFLGDYLRSIRYRFGNIGLDEIYITAQAATTIQNWSLASQIIEHGLGRTGYSPGHATRGRLIALSLLNPKYLILGYLTSPEGDHGSINFGNYDPRTKALLYRSYAAVLRSKSPVRACAFLKVAYELVADIPIDRTIYRNLLDSQKGRLTVAEQETFGLWNDKFRINGIAQPYPSG